MAIFCLLPLKPSPLTVTCWAIWPIFIEFNFSLTTYAIAIVTTKQTRPEFTAKALRKWLARLGVKALFIEPGSPWENEYIESFNGKLRDELLNREIFMTIEEAKA